MHIKLGNFCMLLYVSVPCMGMCVQMQGVYVHVFMCVRCMCTLCMYFNMCDVNLCSNACVITVIAKCFRLKELW